MGLWRGGTSWELSRLPSQVGQAIALCSSPTLPGESLPPTFPALPGLRALILPGLHFSSPPQSPYVLLVHVGIPPISLGVRVLHQRRAGALVVGDANSMSSHATILTLPLFLFKLCQESG